MNVSSLIKQYFASNSNDVTIDVFDEKNIYTVYQRVIETLTHHMNIETTLLQALSYCFYEILDNVLTHSGKELGSVISYYNPEGHTLSLLVADDGQGIRTSLAENEKYSKLTEPEALEICIRDSVTDGKGMGFGLYTTSLLAKDAGLRQQLGQAAYQTIAEPWNAQVAAERFLEFSEAVLSGKSVSYEAGPMSAAEVITPARGYEYCSGGRV